MPVNVRARSFPATIRETSSRPNQHLCHRGSHNDDDHRCKISTLPSHFPRVVKNRSEAAVALLWLAGRRSGVPRRNVRVRGWASMGSGSTSSASAGLRGWPTAQLSSAITAYYVLGATLLFFFVGPLFERYGARKIVLLGIGAMAAGALLLLLATRLSQVYLVFAVMSVGWATMSGAAINIIVAPWFERRRGVSRLRQAGAACQKRGIYPGIHCGDDRYAELIRVAFDARCSYGRILEIYSLGLPRSDRAQQLSPGSLARSALPSAS